MTKSLSLRTTRCWMILAVAMLCLVGQVRHVHGQIEVEVLVDSDIVYVNEPFLINVRISGGNVTMMSQPSFPDVDGLVFQDRPPRSLRQSINGHLTIQLGYQAYATRPGPMEIGPITIDVEGRRYTMEPFTIEVREAANTDRLSVRVRTNPEKVYAGQRFEIIAEIRVKKFEDERTRVVAEADHMFRMIDQITNWGLWEPVVRNVGRQRFILEYAREVQEVGPDGEVATYYYFDVSRLIRANAGGRQPFGPLAVSIDYPESISMVRDFFGDLKPRVTKSSRLMSVPEVDYIPVYPVPRDNRPPTFNGAIGKFRINTIISSRNIKVDDPVTLIYDIIDESEIPAEMELLAGPRLDAVDIFGDGFRVRDEELIGSVEPRGDDRVRMRKIFQQTIRIADENITEIPPIPFTYFDPTKSEFVTIYSRAIPINVSPAERVDVGDLLGETADGAAAASGTNELVMPEPGAIRRALSLASTDGPEQPGVLDAAVVAVPGVLYGCFLIAGRVRERRVNSADRGRMKRARRVAEQRLDAAQPDGGADAAHAVGQALALYVSDRLALDNESPTPEEVRSVLESRLPDVPEALISRAEHIMQRCDAWRYQPGHSDDLAELRSAARAVVGEIDLAT